jgi:NAD(P)H-dependent flavin oxidoreductase YrpB (nitropropane dioxygenase family)
MRTEICERLGIEFPIFAFSHCRDVVAAVTNAGGFGVLGALAFEADRLEIELDWIDEHTKGRPYGVDFAMPAKYVGQGGGEEATPQYLKSLIPQGHRDFINKVLDEAGIPPLPADFEHRAPKAAGLNVDAEGPAQLEVTLNHPNVKMVVNALGPPPKYVVDMCHERGILVGALVGSKQHAERQLAIGVDVLVAQGTEAGGHCGEISTMVLVPQIVDAVAARSGAGRRRHQRRPPDGRSYGTGRAGCVDRNPVAAHPRGGHVPRGDREPLGRHVQGRHPRPGHDG